MQIKQNIDSQTQNPPQRARSQKALEQDPNRLQSRFESAMADKKQLSKKKASDKDSEQTNSVESLPADKSKLSSSQGVSLPLAQSNSQRQDTDLSPKDKNHRNPMAGSSGSMVTSKGESNLSSLGRGASSAEVKEIPFTGTLPHETPISANKARNNQTRVWIATGLNIDMAIDASDKDPLHVVETSTQGKVLQAMEDCGYSLVKADVEEGQLRGNGFVSTTGCYQELEFRPNKFALFGLNEVEISFVPTPDQTHILLELDRNFGGDSYLSLSLGNNISQEEVTAQIKGLLG